MPSSRRKFLETIGAGGLATGVSLSAGGLLIGGQLELEKVFSGNAAGDDAFSESLAPNGQPEKGAGQDGKWEGIWAGLPTPWKEDFSLDERSLETNIRRMIAAPVHAYISWAARVSFTRWNSTNSKPSWIS